MGAALAHALHGAGHDLVVWNRSPGKTGPFAEKGVPCALDVEAAIEASPVILICIDNYASTRAMLDTPAIGPLLDGKVIVQLSSSTPKEALEAADWVGRLGATYVDGAILAGPSDIGTADATILLCGDKDGHERAAGYLTCLGDGSVRYLGTNVRAASALDLAWLMSRYGTFLAALHAARLCQSEDVGVDEFIALVPENPSMQAYARVIHEETFDEFTASLRVWGDALQHIRKQGRDAGINTEIPDFISNLFDRAKAAGLDESNVMSLIKILR